MYELLDGISDNNTKEALLYCSEGCIENITNDTSGHNAGVDYSLVTGQPNIVAPYTKDLFLQVIGVEGKVTYTASIIATGPYKEGPGQSFALPTHYPVMILRDPPGGMSYASYQNVVTKFWMSSYGGSGATYFTSDYEVKAKAEKDADACAGGGVGAIVLVCSCAGGGVGAIVLVCSETAKVNSEQVQKGTFKAGVLLSGSRKFSNEISTTWSFETSQDPWLAGEMSDVFVVPNLNVMYQIVTLVSWNASSCNVTTKDGSFI